MLVNSLDELYNDDSMGKGKDKNKEGEQLQMKVLKRDHFESLVCVADY